VIYLDYNATTPLGKEARAAMQPLLEKTFGNPSSVHFAGREARAVIDDARDRLANLLGAKAHELIFTGGGTEANNLAVLGLARARSAHGKHLVSARTEHHAVLNALEHLEKREGFSVSWLDVAENGLVAPAQLADAIKNETTLVSLMLANNETGVIQPLAEISEICRARRVLLHSDMVQSFGKLPRDYVSLVDAASFAAHKFYGPKGAGLLFLRSGIAIESIHFGGAHENRRRPGTENVAAIAGMAAAAEAVERDRELEQARQGKLRDQLWQKISCALDSVVCNGVGAPRLANTLNLSFNLDSETMLMALDLQGVCASSGSACMVGSVVPSHVLLGMNLPLARARNAVRFSLGKFNTADEIDRAAAIVVNMVERTNARRRPQTTSLSA